MQSLEHVFQHLLGDISQGKPYIHATDAHTLVDEESGFTYKFYPQSAKKPWEVLQNGISILTGDQLTDTETALLAQAAACTPKLYGDKRRADFLKFYEKNRQEYMASNTPTPTV